MLYLDGKNESVSHTDSSLKTLRAGCLGYGIWITCNLSTAAASIG